MQGDAMVGRVFGGVYRVERKLGAGGMGAVYEARHDRTNRRYALKVLLSQAMRDPDIERRFMREAEAIAALGHANIVSVQDFGRDPVGDAMGTPYIVMDLLEGEDLARRIRRTGALPWPAARKIFLEVASALCAAHSVGLVHRDLKPANVFLAQIPGAGERAVLLDFGLVKMLGDPTRTQLTDVGTIMGTPLYMSLEQARGEEVDARADVYSLGCILYEMLAGETPFDAPTPAAFLARLLTEEPTLLTARPTAHAMPPGLDDALAGALAKERDQRFASMQAFADAVAAVGGSGTRPPQAPRAPGAVTGDARTEAQPMTPRPAAPTPPVAGPYTPPPGLYTPPVVGPYSAQTPGAALYPSPPGPYAPPPGPYTPPATAQGGWPVAGPPSTYVQPPPRSRALVWIAAVVGAPLALVAGGLVAYALLARPFSSTPAMMGASPPVVAPPVPPPPATFVPAPLPTTQAPPAPMPVPVAPVVPGVDPPPPADPTDPADPADPSADIFPNGQDPFAASEQMMRAFGGLSEEEMQEMHRGLQEARAAFQRQQGGGRPASLQTQVREARRLQAAFEAQRQEAIRQQATRDAQERIRRHMETPEVVTGTQAEQARAVGDMLSNRQFAECVRAGLAAPYNPFRHAYAAACEMQQGNEAHARAICVDLRSRNPPAPALGFCNAANLR